MTMTHDEIVKELREIGRYLQEKGKNIKARYGEKPEFANEMDEWHYKILMQVCGTIEERECINPYIKRQCLFLVLSSLRQTALKMNLERLFLKKVILGRCLNFSSFTAESGERINLVNLWEFIWIAAITVGLMKLMRQEWRTGKIIRMMKAKIKIY